MNALPFFTAPASGDLDAARRAAEGDAAAFESLHAQYAPRIFAFCLRMRSDRAGAEDLVQEVFLRAWRAIGSFRGESKFSTWLYRIAANLIISENRKKQPQDMAEIVSHYLPHTDLDLERAIASLPPRARLTLLLAIEGYRYSEIAEMTGVTPGTVKTQVHRARALLMEKLK